MLQLCDIFAAIQKKLYKKQTGNVTSQMAITVPLGSELSCLSLGRCQCECEEEATATVVAGRAHTSLQHSPHMSGRESSYLQRFATCDEYYILLYEF